MALNFLDGPMAERSLGIIKCLSANVPCHKKTEGLVTQIFPWVQSLHCGLRILQIAGGRKVRFLSLQEMKFRNSHVVSKKMVPLPPSAGMCLLSSRDWIICAIETLPKI